MYNIVLIGAGNIGSRHLQGLALLKIPVSIVVIDSLEQSLELAKTRFKEVYKGTTISITYQTEFSFKFSHIDVAIIATNSKVRKTVFEQLINTISVKNIVFEKFLFQHIDDYAIVSELLIKHNVKAWVNCPRRMFSAYHKVKDILKNEERFEVTISGSNWGLGCNSVHYLDLYAFLTQAKSIQTSAVFLDKEIIQSKREGYIEFTGTLSSKDERGNTCTITSYKQENRAITIVISSERYQILILEKGNDSKIAIVDKIGEMTFASETFFMPYQSQLSNVMIEDIVLKGECSLATYKESRAIHESILNAFVLFLQEKYNDKNIKSCPVT